MKFAVIIGVLQMTFGKFYYYFRYLIKNGKYITF
jgi:hypothetical protein